LGGRVVEEEESLWVDEWLLSVSPVRSGSVRERHTQWGTWVGLYQACCRAVIWTPFITRGIYFVVQQAKRLQIHRAKYDRYRCPICFQGRNPSLVSFPLKKYDQLLVRFPAHQQFVTFQSTLHKEQRKSLREGEVLLIYDYSRFHETAEVKIHDLGCVLLTANTSKFVDFFATAKHDHHYTTTALKQLFETETLLQQATRVYVWSDGGLRTKENLEDVQEQFDKLAKTTTHHLPAIQKNVAVVKPLTEGIQCFFAFSFPSPGFVACWIKYQEGTPIIQPLVLASSSSSLSSSPLLLLSWHFPFLICVKLRPTPPNFLPCVVLHNRSFIRSRRKRDDRSLVAVVAVGAAGCGPRCQRSSGRSTDLHCLA